MRKVLCFAVLLIMVLAGPVGGAIERIDDGKEIIDDEPSWRDWKYSRPRPANVVDPALEAELSAAGTNDVLEVIVRFRYGVEGSDLDLMRREGLRPERTFDFVDAVHATGTKGAIDRLARSDRVQWMEFNEHLEYMMDESSTTINATKVWNTRIIDSIGKEFPPIDGTGVTAVVLDSGVDAGHPDLDYGEKVIMNLKSDSDGGWVEALNTDTSSGHGTHCSGTIAGNGDASAGSRRGVAPGAQMIGLSTGEAVMILNALGALEWVYEHSRPNNNPYNIRVVSNSWGSSAEYNPDDAIVIASQAITYENNVVVVFAAGNAGADDHDGHTVTTNPYSLTPSSLSIAAMARDGSGIASFSSRGSADNNFTWPDFGAPGVTIWATEARKTLISAMRKQSSEDSMDAYYMAISGTSMATPHISGVVALLFQAAPSLRVSELHDDSMENGTEYWNDTYTRIHEVEWILKTTARYINATGDNGVPDNASIGLDSRPNDYAQGYGIVQVDKAIGLALTLEELRVQDPDATVADALKVYEYTMVHNTTARKTNRMQTNWFGDWSRLNDGNQNVFTTTTHDIVIPNATRDVDIVLNYNPAQSDGWTISSITVTIDFDGDGGSDWSGGNAYSSHGYKEWNVPGNGGGTWSFNVIGMAAQIPDWWRNRNPGDNEFNEITIEYSIGLFVNLDIPEEGNVTLDDWDFHARNGILDWAEPAHDASGNDTGDCQDCISGVVMDTYWYDLRLAKLPEEPPKKKVEKRDLPCIPLAAVGILAFGGIMVYYMKTKRMGPFKAGGAGGGGGMKGLKMPRFGRKPKEKDKK